MNSKLLNTFVLLGLVLSISCSSSTFQALENIKANEFANDFVGQQIVDTILLQQQAGGSADVIVRLLNGLILNLNAQQKQHNAEHIKNNNLWRSQLANYRSNVAKLTNLVNLLSTKILRVEAAIRRSRRNIQNTQIQQRLVTQKQADLKAARNVDRQAFLKRNARQSEMLKAVNYIISQLQLALKSQSFAQLDQIKDQLQKLTKENPLQALVELTMTFQPASVAYAVKKLQEIQAGLGASLKDDVDGEAQAVRQFTKLNNQMNAFLRSASRLLARQQARLARQQRALTRLVRVRREARRLRALYRALIAQTLAQRRAYNLNWKVSRAKRSSEVATVRKVISILQSAYPQLNRSESLSKALKRR